MASLRQTFAQNLRAFRILRGLSQEEIGHHIGSDRTSVSRIERLAPNLTVAKVALLAEALDVRTSYLLSRDAAHREGELPAFKHVGSVGEAVRKLRVEQGLSQQQLGVIAGLDRNQISRVETDASSIALDTLEKIAVALKVTADCIVT